MLGYIKENGELILIEISSDQEHKNVYCNVSVEDFVASPWGKFNKNSLNDSNLGKKAINVLKKIEKTIIVNEKINNSRERP